MINETEMAVGDEDISSEEKLSRFKKFKLQEERNINVIHNTTKQTKKRNYRRYKRKLKTRFSCDRVSKVTQKLEDALEEEINKNDEVKKNIMKIKRSSKKN